MGGGLDRALPLVWIRNQWHEMRYGNGNRRQAEENARFHYALGHDFYKLWLDEALMMYTCGYWREGTRSGGGGPRNKVEHVCRKVRVSPGESGDDLGSGFRGFLVPPHPLPHPHLPRL